MKKTGIYENVCLYFVIPISMIIMGYCAFIALGDTIDSRAIDQKFEDDLEQRGTSHDEFVKDWEADQGRKWQGRK